MAERLHKMWCINPQYIQKKYEKFKGLLENSPNSNPTRLKKHFITKVGACHLFNATTLTSGYRKITLKTIGEEAKINSSIFVYFMENSKNKDALPSVKKKVDISHLCHNRACVNPHHLNREPRKINNQRKNCKQNKPKTCDGHDPYPLCYFPKA